MNFFGSLGLIFIVLKLLDIITWSWWLVLLPLYGSSLVFLLISFFTFSYVSYVSSKFDKKGKK